LAVDPIAGALLLGSLQPHLDLMRVKKPATLETALARAGEDELSTE
jgi:hypothetical protein